ncbi:MAG TPA: hypothetical protein VFW19_04830 [Allosphingosinicella sp.]|nr:hypothetical protein [Allosphingosinicella sp.]
MKPAALLVAFAACACSSSAEWEYRHQLECFALEERGLGGTYSTDYPPPGGLTWRQAVVARNIYRRRLLDAAKALGKDGESIGADLRAYMAQEDKLEWEQVHPSEERVERVMDACAASLPRRT